MAGLRDDFKSMLDKRKAVLNAGTLEGEEKIRRTAEETVGQHESGSVPDEDAQRGFP